MPRKDNKKSDSVKPFYTDYITKVHSFAGVPFEATDVDKWENELASMASMAMSQRDPSCWWLYVLLHTQYTSAYPDAKPLPGFPDMDTAVKTGCPSIYNWYYHYKKYPLVEIDQMTLTDHLALSFSNPSNCSYDTSWLTKRNWLPDLFTLKGGTTLPFWLLKNLTDSDMWPVILEYTHEPYTSTTISAPNKIAIQILPAKMIWQYLILDKTLIVGTLKPTLTTLEQCTALDELRFSHLSQNVHLMEYAKSNFKTLHPDMDTHINIAFDLDAPLAINLPDDIKPDPEIWSPEI